MKEEGCAVVIITHKLGEVMEISDRITVLRKGRSEKTIETDKVEIPSLIEMMVGRKVDLQIRREDITDREPLLRVDNLTVVDSDKKVALDGVSFTLHTSEILGVAGVAGSGQKELCEAIAGLQPAEKGRVFFNDENILGRSPGEIIRLGIRMGFIPEDRLGMGLVASMDIVHNIILKEYQAQKGITLKRKTSVEKAKKIVERLEIQTPGIHTPVSRLSGGNIQKVLLGREIDAMPRVLITAYPVRGLDIGASYKIYELLAEQKRNGVGVIFIGEDLDVLMDLCDRIIVLTGGEMTGLCDARNVSKEELGFLMTGGSNMGGGINS
jgi:simple sugar transport system ATP-binding protein